MWPRSVRSAAAFRPDFHFEDLENAHITGLAGDACICGIDEVGRGPLAGPVVAAAVVLHRDPKNPPLWQQIHDSKKLTALRRADLYARIYDAADVSIALCTVAEIDTINILQASLLAMKKACEALPVMPDCALIDGNKAPKLSCATRTIVKGDSKSLSIAAASIVAKHYRDEIMKKLGDEFPQYLWHKNAGYGTAAHLQALEIHGVTPHHRRSFAPISKLILKDHSVID